MVIVIKDGKDYFLAVARSSRKKHSKLKGGEKSTYFVKTATSRYGKRDYVYNVVSMGSQNIRCPRELLGKWVRVKLEVIENGRRK